MLEHSLEFFVLIKLVIGKMAPLRNYVEERAKISKAGLLVLADLNYELRIVGLRFLLFAILFYFGIPIIYYWLNLGWSVIDSFYVCN